eukprot:7150049-Pyramimonas_sp.AAC.1
MRHAFCFSRGIGRWRDAERAQRIASQRNKNTNTNTSTTTHANTNTPHHITHAVQDDTGTCKTTQDNALHVQK